MHSVCPQIRPTAFNRLDASSCLAPLDTQLKPSPANNSDSFLLLFLFSGWMDGGVIGVKRKKEKKGVTGSIRCEKEEGGKEGTIQFVRFVVHHV